MGRKDDPYYDRKVYHIAGALSTTGHVSALCYKSQRAIPQGRGQSWVLEPERATCPKCRQVARYAGLSTDGGDARPS